MALARVVPKILKSLYPQSKLAFKRMSGVVRWAGCGVSAF